jgi:hypothetical protein
LIQSHNLLDSRYDRPRKKILGLPKLQKISIMEQIWVDLLKEEEQIEVPEWHLEELAKTEKSIQEGKEHFQDWEVAKKAIREA